MFTKMKNKLKNMTTKEWIVMALWSLTLVLLLAFVLVAAVVPQGAPGSDEVLAVSKVAKDATHAKVDEVTYAAAVPADSASLTYATTLASVGGSFVLSLFGALVTTVAFAFIKKRNGGSND